MRAFMISMLVLATTVSAARIKKKAAMVYESGANASLNTSACDPVEDKFDPEVNAPGKETRGVLGDELTLMAEPNILAVAYGPAFNGSQIIAWTFLKQKATDDEGLVLLYYPKPGRLAYDQKNNLAGVLSCGACPSCSRPFYGAGCYADKKKIFKVNAEVAIGSYASGTLRETDAGYKLESQPNCYLHYVWIKHSSCAVPFCVDASGEPCDCQ
jgi:hypothetical protein